MLKYECFCEGLHIDIFRVDWPTFLLVIRCTTSGYTCQMVDIQIDWLAVLLSRSHGV